MFGPTDSGTDNDCGVDVSVGGGICVAVTDEITSTSGCGVESMFFLHEVMRARNITILVASIVFVFCLWIIKIPISISINEFFGGRVAPNAF